jgi:hypothetical protein
MELHQIKTLLHDKENNRMKSQFMDWENIFLIHTFDKGLVSKV